MHLSYFDENKFTDNNPYFWVGGLLIPDKKAIELENTLSQIQYNFFRMVCINVTQHRLKYIDPMPEYRLGLMLLLERFCDYLDTVDDLGIVFGDYEKDELTQSVLDFSKFKLDGKTPMYFGRRLDRLLDTVYFTHSHHSRFLQAADILIFLAGRYENSSITQSSKRRERKMAEAWENIKANGYVEFQIYSPPQFQIYSPLFLC